MYLKAREEEEEDLKSAIPTP